MNKSVIELKNSISTDTVNEDIYSFEDKAAPLVANNGIHKIGGITNIQETEITYSETGSHFYTDDGKIVAIVDNGDNSSTVKVDGKSLGLISTYGVEKKVEIKGFDDVALTINNTYITCKLNNNVVTVSEYDFDNIQLNTRNITFPGMQPISQFLTSFSFVRTSQMTYAMSQEFALRMGEQIVIMQESSANDFITKFIRKVISSTSAPTSSGMTVYSGFLIIITTDGVSSFDGVSWKLYNGTGDGTGPYAPQSLIGSGVACCVYNNMLIVAAGVGLISSFDGVWHPYDGSNGGFYYNLASSISCIIQYGSQLIASGTAGISSYDGSNWKLYNGTGTGTGIFSSTALNIYAMCLYNSNIVFGGLNGQVSSFDGSNWKYYNGTGTGTGPFNNGVVVSTSSIQSMIKYGSFLVVSGASGVGSWDGSNWKNYNGTGIGLGPYLNPGITVLCLSVIGSILAVSMNGAVSSWDGSNWKNYNGTGIGIGCYGTNVMGGVSNATCIIVYNNLFIFGGTNSSGNLSINSCYQYGIIKSLYSINTVYQSDILSGMVNNNYLYIHRYENGLYLINLLGNNLNYIYIYDNSANSLIRNLGQYALPQYNNSKTRHIISETPAISGNELHAISTIGYTDFSVFSSTQKYINNNLLPISISKYSIGIGYSDTVFSKTGASNYWNFYFPIPIKNPLQFYQVKQGNTNTLITGHSKLNNSPGVQSSLPFEIRANYISAGGNPGKASFLSVAVIDSQSPDALGVLLTGIGEFNDNFQTQIIDDNKILYTYNGVFYIIKIGSNISNRIEKITNNLYKFNTISPINIYDIRSGQMYAGSVDYNGKMQFSSTAAVSAVSTKVVSVMSGKFSNSADAGDKLVQITNPTSANFQPFGIRLPLIGSVVNNYRIDTFLNDLYAYSTYSDGSDLVLSDPDNPIYVSDTRIPVAIGSDYSQGVALNNNITIFLSDDYDGYEIGNDTYGAYAPFKLFGQSYLFDGLTIYQAIFDGILLAQIIPICNAYGMQYIASSPTDIYFLSSFDNSLYTFSGGRDLQKAKAFTILDTISKGVFSTIDASLLLDGTNHLIWVRDGIVTQIAKKASQTNLKFYSTSDGIKISNNVKSWQYTYFPRAGSAPVPLSFQTAYFGQTGNQKSILKAFVLTIYNDRRDVVNVSISEKSKDQDAQYEYTHQTIKLVQSDWDSRGYAHVRLQPKYERSLGSSLKIDIPEKATVLDISVLWEDANNATMASNKTR